MHSANHWGGTIEITGETHGDSSTAEYDHRSPNSDWDKASVSRKSLTLDETQRSWLLGPDSGNSKKNKYVDLGCVVCSRKALRWTVGAVVVGLLIITLPIIITKSLPEHHRRPPPPDNYTVALHKALLFFNAQKCTYTSASFY